MNKINSSAKIKKSAKKSATTPTRDQYKQLNFNSSGFTREQNYKIIVILADTDGYRYLIA